ncbi:serine acetyltransferase [Candidatus Marinamargulisbacteria bacterium SCGC AG-333-B06]|nr:serine acetyltransferase [Candidatus Marinamargulisbacteria bacterium SCGC AG-333-B06]
MINQYKQSIIRSYEDTGIINISDGIHYPPKQLLVDILELIKEILFPGFFGTVALKDADLDVLLEKRLIQLQEYLIPEVFKCLYWNPEQDLVISEDKAKQLADDIVYGFFDLIPSLRLLLKYDANAIYQADPAAKSLIEVILSYPGFQAVMVYRIAHYFYQKDVPLIPRMFTEIVHFQTAIDIHPGATIGESFCIDHGTGIVIGETAVIGKHVMLYQGVTLGAFSTKDVDVAKKRHPTIEDGVTIYSMSTILGGDTVVGAHSVVGGNVWLTRSIPANSKIYLSEDFNTTYRLVTKDST